MAVTIKDVANKAGVSRSAVSRSFTEGASVSKKMRTKVMEAANHLGYSPNALASSLTTGRTKLIGLVSNNFHNPIFLEVFDLFTQGLQERGLRPLLVNLSGETDPSKSIHMLRQYSVDGVVVASSTLPPEFASQFFDANIPVVHSFGRQTTSPAVHIVGIDNIEAGAMAARTLIERGYKNIAFLGGPDSATSTQDRLAGFQKVARPASTQDIKVNYSFAEAYSFNAGRTEMQRLLNHNPAEAYFCGDDVLSIGALSAIQSAGLSVPNDIGLIGFNDMEMAEWANINLTTIRQPLDLIIKHSIDLIVEMLEKPELEPQVTMFPLEIVERGTLREVIFQK